MKKIKNYELLGYGYGRYDNKAFETLEEAINYAQKNYKKYHKCTITEVLTGSLLWVKIS